MAITISFFPSGSRKNDVEGRHYSLRCQIRFTRSSLSWGAARAAGHEFCELRFGTSIKVVPSLFSDQRVSRKHPDAGAVNDAIEAAEKQAIAAHAAALMMPVWPDDETFEKMCVGSSAEVSKGRDVLSDHASYVKWLAQKGVSGKYRNDQVLMMKNVRDFFAIRRMVLSYEKFTISFEGEFSEWLKKNRKKGKGPLHSNTVSARLRLLKSFLLFAVDSDFTKADGWKKIHPKTKDSHNRVVLSLAEVDRMNAVEAEDLKKNGIGLRQISAILESRDWFVFACFVGPRSVNWKSDQLKISERDGFFYAAYISTKKNKAVEVPLNPRVVRMLEKRQWVFPKEFTYDSIRRHLFNLAEAAKIEKHVTSHVARRTFATLAESAGAPRAWVMAAGGWRDERSYLRYMNFEASDAAESLAPILTAI